MNRGPDSKTSPTYYKERGAIRELQCVDPDLQTTDMANFFTLAKVDVTRPSSKKSKVPGSERLNYLPYGYLE